MRSSTTFSFVSLSALFVLSGCSLLNAPNRDLIHGDAGAVDMRVFDAGPDIGADVFDGGPEVCDEPGDEDDDGLSDCSDSDCAGHPACCMGGESTNIGFEEPFPAWRTIGNVEVRGTQVRFPGTTPSTYVNNTCFPLARGAVFEFDVLQDFAIDCVDDACDDFVAIFLSSVRTAPMDSRIVAELGVTIHASGRAELYRGRDNRIEEINVNLPNGGARVILRVAPDVVDGEAVLRAEVTVAGMTFTEMPVIRQRDLIAGCRDGISGLYYGVEGQGRRLPLESNSATATTLECTNPTQFTSSACVPVMANGDDRVGSLEWVGDWTAGDITHPELVRQDEIWHVYGSTSSQQLEFSYLPDFPWSMAHSATSNWNEGSEWELALDDTTAGREPTVVLGSVGELIRFGVIDDVIHRCTGSICTPTGITCPGLANPSVARAPMNNFVLFYQCGAGAEQEVYVRALTPTVTPSDDPATLVLRASALGSLARNGIVDFDVLLDERGEEENPEYLVRAWFVAEALGNVRTLLLATGAMKLPRGGVTDVMDELRVLGMGVTLVPYPANPIATENVLFRDPMQSLQGVSVEHTGDPRNLLFLFGRRTERPEGRLFDFVPVEQTWGTL